MNRSVEELVAVLEKKVSWQQGMIEILLGLASSNIGPGAVHDFISSVANSNQFSEEARSVATECVRQNTLWPRELLEQQKLKPQ